MSTLLEVKDLSVSFATKNNQVVPVIDQVSFSLMRGETLGLVGESGCGKTLSSLSIMGLLPDSARISQGQIRFQDENLLTMTEKKRNHVRGVRMGMIFQDPMTSLSPYYTIGNQLTEGMRYHLKLSKKAAKARGLELLHKVGIAAPEHVYNEYPSQLSGGMRQRVMIAIALSCEPDLLIADEPTTALDVTTQAQILELLKKLQQENGMSLILVSHDLGVIAQMCNRVVVMYAGLVVEESTTKDLFAHQGHPYTRALLAATPRLGEKQTRFFQIEGMVPTPSEWGEGCRFRSRCSLATEACKQVPPFYSVDHTGRKARCWFAGEQLVQQEVRA